MSESVWNNPRDYHVPLLRLMANLPGGQGGRPRVHSEFWQQHEDQIPPHHLEPRGKSRQAYWQTIVDWCRYTLARGGFMDSPESGVWRITREGRDWLEHNLDATGVPPEFKNWRSGSHSERSHPASPSVAVSSGAMTPEMLQQTRQVMPAEQFRRVWGTIYDQLSGDRREATISPSTDRTVPAATRVDNALGRNTTGTTPVQVLILTREVAAIRDFLAGRAGRPNDERLCEWVSSCRNFELFSDGLALFRLVEPSRVNPWYYERAKEQARVCELKIAPKKLKKPETPMQKEKREFMERLMEMADRNWYAVHPKPRPTKKSNAAISANAVEGLPLLKRELAAIRTFLAGLSIRPSDERLCDWVQFCYTFELFAQGQELFRLVEPSQVNPWCYDRTKRLARVCAMKAVGQA
jgi:hypothetical protein